MHLAQLNIALTRAPLDDPSMEEFTSNLDAMNALAESSPGFVWRLKDEDGTGSGIALFERPEIIINLTVWESVEALKNYVYKTQHVYFVRNRKRWFLPLEAAHYALWWVPPGHLPPLAEAEERLSHLRRHGPTEQAFQFQSVPVSPGLVE